MLLVSAILLGFAGLCAMLWLVGSNRECQGCAACEDHIESLKEELRWAQETLVKAMRLGPSAPSPSGQSQVMEPISARQGSWNKVKRDLEKKYSAKSPEDRTEEYWKQKNEETVKSIPELGALLTKAESD